MTGRQDDERVAHLTHVSEIKKKSEALAKTTATLQDVIHNKVIFLLVNLFRSLSTSHDCSLLLQQTALRKSTGCSNCSLLLIVSLNTS